MSIFVLPADPFVRAREYLQSGDTLAARRLIRTGLTLQPASAAGLTVAGHIAVRDAAANEAVDLFRRAALADAGGDSRALLNLARAQQMAGRTSMALSTAERALAMYPEDARPRGFAALLHAQAGRFDAAVAVLHLGDAARLDPVTAFKLATLLIDAGVHSEPAGALLARAATANGPMLDRALKDFIAFAAPDDERRFTAARRRLVLTPDALDAMGAAEHGLGLRRKLVRQAAWRWQACCVSPWDHRRRMDAADLLFEVKWPAHGIAALRELMRGRPHDQVLVERMAELYDRKKDKEGALAWGQALLATEPRDPRIWDAIVGMFKAVGAVDEAAALWPTILCRFPQYEALHYNCALFLDSRGEFAGSEQRCKAALVLKPDYLRAANQLSMLAARGDRTGDAIRYVNWPLRVDPTYANGHTNLGVYLRTAAAYGRAIDAFRRAEKFAANPQQAASGRFNAGVSKILIGEIEDGFNLLESRWATADFTSPKRDFRQKIWPGPYFKPDSRLLLYMEQGMGDEIMLSWYVPLLRRDTARLLVECDERLVELFSRTYEGVEFVPRSRGGHPATRDPGLQYKIPSFHVPQYYAPEVKFLIRDNWDWAQNRGSRFPSRLAIRPDRLEHWRTWLDDRFPGRRRIGVSWRSKVRNRTRDTQYLSIQQVASAIPPGCAVVNLQYSSTPEEMAEFEALGQRFGFDFVTPPDVDLTNDLEDVLAILQVADAAVTPLISLAWMSGAVGCPAFVFRSAAEMVMWHQLGTPFIPWAPSLRVFFRHPSEDWAPTIVDLRTRLARFLSAGC